MASTLFNLTTGSSTNLTNVRYAKGISPDMSLTGYSITNTAAYAIFVKFYWFQSTASVSGPTVGTTVPNLTVNVATVSTREFTYPMGGLTGYGDLWIAVTKAAAATDTTATVAGDGILTLFLG